MMYRTGPWAPTAPPYYETETLLVVPWPEVTRILGRDYAGGDDDPAVFAALRAAQAPSWLGTTLGFLDEDLGWCLERPARLLRRAPLP